MRRAVAGGSRGLTVQEGFSLGHLSLRTGVGRFIHKENVPRPLGLDSDRVVRRAIADASRGLTILEGVCIGRLCCRPTFTLCYQSRCYSDMTETPYCAFQNL